MCQLFLFQAGPSPFAGQWSSASLGSDERNDKFFRLMGGFKKSNIDSGKQKFSTFALDQKREEKLNNKLLNQYEQAWETTREKRGKGLGFSEDVSDEKKPSFSWE